MGGEIGNIPRESDHVWEPPAIVVREIPDSDTQSNTATGLAGRIRTDMRCPRYTVEPGPVGGSAEIQLPNELWLDSTQLESEREDFRGSIFTVEQRRRRSSGDRTLQTILFRGKQSSVSKEKRIGANGRSLDLSDWFVFHDAPIAMPTQDLSGPLSAGAIFAAWVRGAYIQSQVVNGNVSSTATAFPLYPFPLDASGNPIASIDETLLGLSTMPGRVALSGQRMAQAFAEVLEVVNPDLIPAIRYESNGFAYLTAIAKGENEREIVVAPQGVEYDATEKTVNCVWIEGVEDDSQRFNAGQGVGGFERTVTVHPLIPDWTEAEETICRNNPENLKRYRYSHVGYRYRLPKKVFQTAGVPFAPSAIGKSERMKFRARRTGGEWRYIDLDIENPRIKQRSVIDRGTPVDQFEIHPDDGSMAVVWLKTSTKYDYFTEAQRAQQSAGVPVQPSIGFLDLEVEAVGIGPKLEVRYTAEDDYPRQRMIQIENPNAVKYIHVDHLEIDDEGGTLLSTEVPENLKRVAEIRDDAPMLLSQLENVIVQTTRPNNVFRLQDWKYDPTWNLGDKINRIVDSLGNIMADNLAWFVIRIDHNLDEWVTTLTVSNNRVAPRMRSVA